MQLREKFAKTQLPATLAASNRLEARGNQDKERLGERVTQGQPGWGSQNQGLARDWRSLRLLTDVPPGPLKGLLTHFDYSGPLVTENITSKGTMNWRRLSCAASLMPQFPSLPAVPTFSPGRPDSKQATYYILRHLKQTNAERRVFGFTHKRQKTKNSHCSSPLLRTCSMNLYKNFPSHSCIMFLCTGLQTVNIWIQVSLPVAVRTDGNRWSNDGHFREQHCIDTIKSLPTMVSSRLIVRFLMSSLTMLGHILLHLLRPLKAEINQIIIKIIKIRHCRHFNFQVFFYIFQSSFELKI